jgi:hypothetical protein
MLTLLEEGQTSIINRFHPSHKDKIGGYRFINNNRIPQQMLTESLQDQCEQNCKGLALICLQDTTEYNYQHHSERLQEDTLGLVGNNLDTGFFAHVMLCFEAESCLPLGIPYVQLWSRDCDKDRKDKRGYKGLTIEKKESYRWIKTAEETKSLLRLTKHITFLSDRESDIYQIWSRVPDGKTDLIIRARVDRVLYDKPTTVFKLLEEQEISGSYMIELKEDKRKKRSKRQVKLNVKYSEVKIRKPESVKGNNENDKDHVSLYVVEAKEDLSTVKKEESPVHWILFTTHKISEFTQARQIIQWYSFRWQIEQFFRITKKQGLDLESSQLETGEGLKKLALLGFAAALKILQLSLARDGTQNDKIVRYFSKDQIIVLNLLNDQLQGNTNKQQNPFSNDSLSWASWIIARLGGYSGYRSQSPPGPITFKWGLDKFNNLTRGFYLAKNVYKE